jgi:hypothetical protein
MWKWNNIQWIGFISITGGVVGALIAILINTTNVFYRESLDTKYCYYYIEDTMQFVLMARNVDEAMEVRTFYVDSSVKSVSVTSKGFAPYRPESDVLKYSKDSLFAKIRVKESGVRGGTFTKRGWVPAFTLHDTLPDWYYERKRRINSGK